MKLNDKFIIHKDNDGIYVIPTASAEFNGFVQGNKSVMTITAKQSLMIQTFWLTDIRSL